MYTSKRTETFRDMKIVTKPAIHKLSSCGLEIQMKVQCLNNDCCVERIVSAAYWSFHQVVGDKVGEDKATVCRIARKRLVALFNLFFFQWPCEVRVKEKQ